MLNSFQCLCTAFFCSMFLLPINMKEFVRTTIIILIPLSTMLFNTMNQTLGQNYQISMSLLKNFPQNIIAICMLLFPVDSKPPLNIIPILDETQFHVLNPDLSISLTTRIRLLIAFIFGSMNAVELRILVHGRFLGRINIRLVAAIIQYAAVPL